MFFKNTFKLLSVCLALLGNVTAMNGEHSNPYQGENEQGESPQPHQQVDVPGLLVGLSKDVATLNAKNQTSEGRLDALEALTSPEGTWSKRLKYTVIAAAVPTATFSLIWLFNKGTTQVGDTVIVHPVMAALLQGWSTLVASYPNLARNTVITLGATTTGLFAALRVATTR